jgi:hypothetical protein
VASPPVIPPGTPLFIALASIARTCRCAVFAGLPGTGKSLLAQQAAWLAHTAGREVFMLQWDVVRAPFEHPRYDARYPRLDGIAHPVVRLAVDHWLRPAIARWQAAAGRDALLVIEAPLIGGRLLSLAKPMADGAEDLLASEETLFLLPVPTAAVKDALRRKRHASMAADPSQPDAAVDVLDGLVDEIAAAAIALGIAGPATRGYHPEMYAGVYLSAMRARHSRRLEVDQVFEVGDHAVEPPVRRLEATELEVASAFASAAAVPAPDRDRQFADWYR